MRKEYYSEIIDVVHEIKEDLINGSDISHTFILGDLIEDSSPSYDKEKLSTLCTIFDDWPSEVTFLLGNHDIGTLQKSSVANLLGQELFYGTVVIQEQPFVYLDSTEINVGARGTVGSDQRNWLEKSIPVGAIVLSHHPIGKFNLIDNTWFSDHPERAYLWDRKEVLDIITDTATATLSGHIHQTETTEQQGVRHHSVTSVSKETPNKAVSGNYAILTIEEEPRLHYHSI